LSDNRSAFIFPAFTSDYTDHPGQNMRGFDEQFNKFLHRAAGSIDRELAAFNFVEKTFLEDELRTQYITYLYSCTASFLLRRAQLFPVMTAGYSMGIYAALFDSGSITFEAGLELIRAAFGSLKASLNDRPFGMGTLIGLDDRDIHTLIEQSSLRVEITNQNASHSFVVSGYRDDVHKLMELAKEDGALHTRDLTVSVPYHSSYLEEGAIDFSRQISRVSISAPATPMISLIDQVLLPTPDIIRQEIIRNLFQPLNWFNTMRVMMRSDVSQFIECGPSRGLAKNARFMDGIRFSPLPSILP
jgi:malonyl CoA-acyl carrier protein transacylase